MKIKLIDLLNKISNGELEDLALVKFCKHDCLTIYHKADNRFEFTNKGDWEDYFYKIDIEELNDEVEVIEEDKVIKKLNGLYMLDGNESAMPTTLQDFNNRDILKKINELIDAVNELKGGNDE